jgi:predicted nucleotidyltransferase
VAQQLLARARTEVGDWRTCVGLLANACDYAVAAVLLACGYPVASRQKIRAAADAYLADTLGDDLIACNVLWDEYASGRTRPPDGRPPAFLVDVVGGLVGRLEAISANPPPLDLPPAPAGLGWNGLSDRDRDILGRAAARVKTIVPKARVLLYGSRATGTSREDSDYDLLIVVPSGTAEAAKPIIMGELYNLGNSVGVRFDREAIDPVTWNAPPPEQRLHLDEVRRVAVEAPDES